MVDMIAWRRPGVSAVRNSSTALRPRYSIAAAPLAAARRAGVRVRREELGDRQVERPGDAVDGGDRRAGHVPFDLRQEALRDPGSLRHVAQGQVARLAQRPDAGPSCSSVTSGRASLWCSRLGAASEVIASGCHDADRSQASMAARSERRALTSGGPAPTMRGPVALLQRPMLDVRHHRARDRR